ncbi:hypothetical protein HMPREF9120_01973 [Neisseria sp. oral taxon 020 str. F0370]|nr:hypothetical protein HMPREF9120_01973 [Neisseria sp. oral taxon 020 str. F0370]
MFQTAFFVAGCRRKTVFYSEPTQKDIVSQNKKDTRQQAVDSTDSTARRSNAVDFLFWFTIQGSKP